MDCHHEWRIHHSNKRAYAVCDLCDLECDHQGSVDGVCEDCGLPLPDNDEREDRAYENWRERDL